MPLRKASALVAVFVVGVLAEQSIPQGKAIAVDPAPMASDSCLVQITGDVNADQKHTAADIICTVHFVFLGPCEPQPCRAAADVTCNGIVTSADIIVLINYVFKSGTPPCDVCTIIPELWTCP